MKESEFDQKAKDWDTPDKIARSGAIAEAIRQAVPLSKDWLALEYGCGTGLLSFALKKDLKKITLVDQSEGMLEVLNQKIKDSKSFAVRKWHTFQLDLMNEPPLKIRFDLIYTQLTLHHIMDTKGILERFYQLLKIGGHLCIADLDKEDGSFHGKEITNVHRGYERGELQLIAEEVGFQNVSFTTAYQLEHEINDKGDKKVFPMFLMTARR